MAVAAFFMGASIQAQAQRLQCLAITVAGHAQPIVVVGAVDQQQLLGLVGRRIQRLAEARRDEWSSRP